MLAAALAAPFAVAALAAPPAAAQETVAVKVDAVKRQPMSQTFTVIGRLVARRHGVVAARVEGAVTALAVDVGDRVGKGDVLAVIDPDRMRWRRDVAAAEVAEGKASVANAEARLAMAEARVAVAEARLAIARQELARLEGLTDSAAFSPARYDDQRQKVSEAIGELDVARAEVQEALSLIDQNRARTARAEATLKLAAKNLADTEIRAPFAGVVTLRHTEIGAYLEFGDSVVTLVNDRDVEVEADVPYNRLAGLAPGVPVVFRLDDGVRYRAVVRAVGAEENPRTRTRPVRFTPRFDTVPDDLAAGQSAAVDIPIGPPREVVSVHKDAVVHEPDGAVVYVVAGGVAERRKVALGEAVGTRLEVLSGLEVGELVVVRGNERLDPGQPVAVEGAS